jgi:hypothetical protein
LATLLKTGAEEKYSTSIMKSSTLIMHSMNRFGWSRFGYKDIGLNIVGLNIVGLNIVGLNIISSDTKILV